MTAAEHVQLISLDRWRELDEDTDARTELQEGVLIVAPRPTPAHARILSTVLIQLASQMTDGFELLPEVEVVVDSRTPPTIRVPDLIVRITGGPDSVVTADQVVLAVEIVSPGSQRTDRVTKRSEYAEAGIAYYWIIQLDRTVTVLQLADGGYVQRGSDSEYSAAVPFVLSLEP